MKVFFKMKFKGELTEHAMNLNTTVTIGRSRNCQIQLEDQKTSGQHCQFLLKRDKLELTDSGSKNGTYLNGIRIEQSEVFIGDQVRVGDTFITLEESKMDAESVEILTFPGPNDNRVDNVLKADFTGARIQNQQVHEKIKAAEMAAHEKEVSLRKKARSKIRLSKQEIRANHKVLSLLTTLIDGMLIFVVLLMPILIFSKKMAPILLLGLGIISAIAYFYLTFKKMKFTLGEQITGIQDLHNKQ